MEVKTKNLICIEHLKKYFSVRKGLFSSSKNVKAVDNVSFDIPKNSTFGIVGESGSGKTTIGRTILRLIEPTSGVIRYLSTDITSLNKRELRIFRRKMQIVSQDPYNSLHPRKLVKNIIGEGLQIHFNLSSEEIHKKVRDILEQVGLREEHMFRYPHEFSGGQRQRISVARALVLKPEFLILDEPTSSLDVSVQAVILKMFKDLKRDFSLTYLFITHDLAVIDYMTDYMAVMYLGQIMEVGTKDDIFLSPKHPYTVLLLNSIPYPDPRGRKKKVLPKGEIPSPIDPPQGCRFHTRCPYVKNICLKVEPEIREIGKGHLVKCHFPLIS
ncbi:ATP-binding cassette domain-containing protein [Candidatus Atribacteria bacterium 1244-E10-H5-B2]|nr:MAG: ATP-binding cassette domain-containing protein [Candidatus Atribacteria bacterium 1244-E10-H5-B2]